MDTVILKNGAEEVKLLVAITFASIKDLYEKQPLAFCELVTLCHNSDYVIRGSFKNDLKKRRLIENGGTVHKSIKNIVLSAVEGEGLEMILINPVAGL